MSQSAEGMAATQVAGFPAMTIGLVTVNLLFSIVANAAFRLSARGGTWGHVVGWQVVGNLAGFVTVLALTGLLRYVPLSVAFPVTTGVSIVGVQVVAASWLFHEPIEAMQWLGSLVIAVGVFLVQRR